MKPNFLVIGAAKAGTTTLCELMGKHPDVYMFPHKETHFFSHHYDRGIEWYESKFDPPASAKAVGEGSPTYAEGRPDIAKNIHRHLPDARLIYIVRHPIQRIESEYVQLIDNGQSFSSLDDAIKRWQPLVDNSCYLARIDEFRKYFDDSKILVLFTGDLRSNPVQVLAQCFDFLEVDPSVEIHTEGSALNTRATKQIDSSLMQWLRRQSYFLDIKWMLPVWLTRKLKPLLRRSVTVEIQWQDRTRKAVIERLKAEIPNFLVRYGKPENYWELN